MTMLKTIQHIISLLSSLTEKTALSSKFKSSQYSGEHKALRSTAWMHLVKASLSMRALASAIMALGSFRYSRAVGRSSPLTKVPSFSSG